MTAFAAPFLVLPDAAVDQTPWLIGSPGGAPDPLGDAVPHWDYARDLLVSVAIAVDWPVAAEALGLEAAALRLRASIHAGTGVGRLPRQSWLLESYVLDVDSPGHQFAASLRGRELSGRLRLDLSLALESASGRPHILSPIEVGSRVWSNAVDATIENGGDARFPVETASFGVAFPGRKHQHAPWYLQWRPGNWHEDFSANVRLFVNTDRADFLDRFVKGDDQTVQTIMSDVMSQMAESLVDAVDDEGLLHQLEPGSVGHQIRYWLQSAFPGEPIASLKSLRQFRPGEFRAALVAAADFGELK